MQITEINREESGIFSDQHIRLVHKQAEIEKYVQRLFSEEMLVHQVEAKKFEFTDEKRNVLVQALKSQYGSISENKPNFDRLLSPNTFTVTTGHQLTLLAGPMYFVVKILEVIKLSEELNKKYPNTEIVPVFWMASEDHDFEEIQGTNLFNQSLSVDYAQRGPVGRFSIEALEGFKSEVLNFFGEDKRAEIEPLLEAYNGKNLADATRNLVHHLFGERGLVIVDGDDPALKKLFAPIVLEELKFGKTQEAVHATNESLEADGFKIQVHARPINLFYIENGLRERIVRTEIGFEAGEKSWTEQELYDFVESSPECFSPNALMRPLYQEVILPNIAYIGGAGEISYWLQLKGVFDAYSTLYPIIKVRNSVLWIDRTTTKRMEKIDMDWKQVFKDVDVLKKEYVKEHASEELDFSELNQLLTDLSSEMEARTLGVDANMKQFAASEITRLEKQLDNFKAKLVKATKGQHDQAMKSIETVKDRLFPNGGLQERSANFLSFCADGSINATLNQLHEALNPFSENLIVLIDSDSAK